MATNSQDFTIKKPTILYNLKLNGINCTNAITGSELKDTFQYAYDNTKPVYSKLNDALNAEYIVKKFTDQKEGGRDEQQQKAMNYILPKVFNPEAMRTEDITSGFQHQTKTSRIRVLKDRIDIMTKELDDEIDKLGRKECEGKAKPKARSKILPKLERTEVLPWKKVEQFPLPLHLYEEFDSLYDTGGVLYGPSFLKARDKEYGQFEDDSADETSGEEINAVVLSNVFKDQYKKLYEDVPISEQKATVTADTKTDIQKQRENILRGKFGQPTMVYSNISSEARQILREVDDK